VSDIPLVKAYDLDTSPPEFLVEDIIPFTGTGFIWGESRVGKSLLVNGELALAVANGSEFFGKKTVQSSVAICMGEGLYDAGVRKLARLAREQNDRQEIANELLDMSGDLDKVQRWVAEQTPYTDDNLYYMTEPFVLPLDNGGAKTSSLRSAMVMLKQIPQLGMVILDSLADFTPSLSISNDASANRIVQGMKMMARELDCVVLAVAHPLRDNSRMLGAGRLFNSSDFVIKIEAEGAVGTAATVSCEKNKYSKPFEPFGYTIEGCAWEDETSGTIVETATVRPRHYQERKIQAQRPARKLPTFIKREQADSRRTGLRAV
jgi:hypothetical protein